MMSRVLDLSAEVPIPFINKMAGLWVNKDVADEGQGNGNLQQQAEARAADGSAARVL